ncbi:MAG: type II toxin-antitoxin system Phd/YefM family antitoxin [Deltaproteobacteria bacterium]|nr:type II toxin-antitoxin system Phd/YefM family antitoxin [Deltaproteobacteria bacterium]
MRLTEDIKPLTYVESHSTALLEELNLNKRPIVITQEGAARAVLLDIESYEKQKNTLLMLKLVAMGEMDIKKGRIIEQEEVFSRLDQKYGE